MIEGRERDPDRCTSESFYTPWRVDHVDSRKCCDAPGGPSGLEYSLQVCFCITVFASMAACQLISEQDRNSWMLCAQGLLQWMFCS
jgi:hypothetical protein